MRTTLVIVALILASGASLAGDLKVVMRPVTSFGYLDTDKDSRITPKEAEADWAVVKSFGQADTNHDGYLDKEEFAALSKS
jgi:hypothetical protein